MHTADNQLVTPLGLLHDPQHAWAEDIFFFFFLFPPAIGFESNRKT